MSDPMGADDHRLNGGQSWPIDYRRGFLSSTTAATGMAAYRQSLRRRDGNARADASRSRGNGGTRRCGSAGEGAARNDPAGRSRRCGGFGRRGEHPFLLITSKRSVQAALRRTKPRTKPQRPGLHDLHVVAELLALAVFAGLAFYVRAEILVVFLRQLPLDVFHYA